MEREYVQKTEIMHGVFHTMKVHIDAEIFVTNMSDEMFNDGLFYKEQAELTENQYLKWRYNRTALVCFCASAESWVNSLLDFRLRYKGAPLTTSEQALFTFLDDPAQIIPPSDYNSIRKRLYNIMPIVMLNRASINWNRDPQQEFDDYINQLSSIRNSIVHYAYEKNHQEVYGDALTNSVNAAPQIIENLFRRYKDLNGDNLLQGIEEKEDGVRVTKTQPILPSWFTSRSSRTIE